jgi:hypothetical protein
MLFWKGWKSRQMKSRQWILQSSISDEYLDASFPRWMGTLMHKFMDRKVPGCIIVWMEEYPAASMFGRKSTWLHQCLDGRVTRCISSWMDVYPRKYGYAKWNTFPVVLLKTILVHLYKHSWKAIWTMLNTPPTFGMTSGKAI